jgi:16S rRNA (guanine966-N2)-methyltransferase
VRIVAGRYAGTPLTSPGGRVRPTAEALRDAWLTALEPELAGARVLDLFAGSGALGLEAISRGAGTADFVEDNPAALHSLKANVARLRLKGRARIFKKDVLPFVDRLERNSYDIALVDPPYGSGKLERVLARWRALPFSRIIGCEHAAEVTLPGRGRRIRVGDSAVTLLKV